MYLVTHYQNRLVELSLQTADFQWLDSFAGKSPDRSDKPLKFLVNFPELLSPPCPDC